jgi:hypothetical protein
VARFNAEISKTLLRALKKASRARGLTLKDWLIEKATGETIEYRHAVAMKEAGK